MQRFDSASSPYGLRNHQRTAVTGDARIRQRKHPLGTHKSSRNCCHGRHTDWTTQKPHRDSQIINELLARVTHGFDSAKQHLETHKSSTNCCHRRRTDSRAHTAPRDSQIINELLARVMQGFDSASSPYGLRNRQRTDVTGDAGIRQRNQPLRTQKSSTNCCHGRHTDLTAQKRPRDSQIINELLARVTLDSANTT